MPPDPITDVPCDCCGASIPIEQPFEQLIRWPGLGEANSVFNFCAMRCLEIWIKAPADEVASPRTEPAG